MFFWTFHLPYSPHKFRLFMYFFFEKWYFYSLNLIIFKYLLDCHCHQYTNHHEQLIWSSWCTSNPFTLILSQFLWTKNNISFTFSLYSSKKPKILILIFFKVHRAIQAHDSWWVALVWDSGCLEKTYVC